MAEYPTANADGSKQLDKDAVKGFIVAFVLQVGGTAVLGYLNQLDLSTLPGWLGGAATLAVSTIVGVITTYMSKKK